MTVSDTLGQRVRECLDTRIKGMHAHAKTLNIFLQMNIAALRGNDDLTRSIHYISERLPNCYVGADKGECVYAYIVGQSFIALISEFENLLVELMSIIATSYPQKLGAESFRLAEILELGDQGEIVRVAAERYINGIMYKRASEYRKSLADVLSADENFLADRWAGYVECKARRDLGVHNGWKINDTYRRKVQEVDMQPSTDIYLAPSDKYFFEALRLLLELSHTIADHCTDKFRAPVPPELER